MSKPIVNVCDSVNVRNQPCDLSKDHVVVLDDGDTYSAVAGARVYLDGKGYDIGDLLDFYLASVVREDMPNHNAISEGGERETCPCGSDEHSILECPVDDWQ